MLPSSSCKWNHLEDMITNRTFQHTGPILVSTQLMCWTPGQALYLQGDPFQIVCLSSGSTLLAFCQPSTNRIHDNQPQSWKSTTHPFQRRNSASSSIFTVVSFPPLRFVFHRFVLQGETGSLSHKSTVREGLVCFLASCATQKPELLDLASFMPLLTPITENGRRNDYELS